MTPRSWLLLLSVLALALLSAPGWRYEATSSEVEPLSLQVFFLPPVAQGSEAVATARGPRVVIPLERLIQSPALRAWLQTISEMPSLVHTLPLLHPAAQALLKLAPARGTREFLVHARSERADLVMLVTIERASLWPWAPGHVPRLLFAIGESLAIVVLLGLALLPVSPFPRDALGPSASPEKTSAPLTTFPPAPGTAARFAYGAGPKLSAVLWYVLVLVVLGAYFYLLIPEHGFGPALSSLDFWLMTIPWAALGVLLFHRVRGFWWFEVVLSPGELLLRSCHPFRGLVVRQVELGNVDSIRLERLTWQRRLGSAAGLGLLFPARALILKSPLGITLGMIPANLPGIMELRAELERAAPRSVVALPNAEAGPFQTSALGESAPPR